MTGLSTDNGEDNDIEATIEEKFDLILEYLQNFEIKLEEIEEKLQNMSVPYDEDLGFRES